MEEFGNVEEKGKKLWSDLRVFENVEESRVLMVEVDEKLDKERINQEKKFIGGKNQEWFALKERLYGQLSQKV